DTGPDTPRLTDGAYPFMIQSQRRTGLANHAFDGARTTLFLHYNGETRDLAEHRTRCLNIVREEGLVKVYLEPVVVAMASDLSVEVSTSYTFLPDGRIIVERTIQHGPAEGLECTEYVKGC